VASLFTQPHVNIYYFAVVIKKFNRRIFMRRFLAGYSEKPITLMKAATNPRNLRETIHLFCTLKKHTATNNFIVYTGYKSTT
jgi:hypothetical protein